MSISPYNTSQPRCPVLILAACRWEDLLLLRGSMPNEHSGQAGLVECLLLAMRTGLGCPRCMGRVTSSQEPSDPLYSTSQPAPLCSVPGTQT